MTEIPDVSSLLNLETFSFEYCEKLITIHESVGFLDKLKVLSAKGCSKLRRFPPIKLKSLEQLNLSFCKSLKNFPQILWKKENITELGLEETPIKEFPCSFQSLTRLQTLQLHYCGTFRLPNNIFMMPNLVNITAWKSQGWILPKQDEGEQRDISIVSSNVERLHLIFCILSDDFFPSGLTWFRNVKELSLAHNNFTILPECIQECHFLTDLNLDYCQYLQEVRGIVPNLEIFSASHCRSWTCIDMLLNQELHGNRNTMFYLPGARILNWFEHRSSGQSISLWFRNKFPAIALCFAARSMLKESTITPNVIINCYINFLHCRYAPSFWMEPDHTYIFIYIK